MKSKDITHRSIPFLILEVLLCVLVLYTDVAITAPVFQIRIDKSRDRYHICSQGIIFVDTEVEKL